MYEIQVETQGAVRVLTIGNERIRNALQRLDGASPAGGTDG